MDGLPGDEDQRSKSPGVIATVAARCSDPEVEFLL